VSVTEQLVSCPEQKQLDKEMCAVYSSILLQYCNKNIFWQKPILPAKTIFASPVFSMENSGFSTFWQKPANPGTGL